ncbi:Legume lectin domain protein [Heracleum sosnowskyi]|uniref:non-specific serine/threonine protein kinase n=1 Tax=Heracleum sosnowskyi TaxID=360622 RepID=A0AAD8IKJ6_9APIA|nr:Legume lectin domain protein [Heracleum sosnowskyi]
MFMFLLAAVLLLGCFSFQARSLNFSYSNFTEEDENKFTLYDSEIYSGAIQVTRDSNGDDMRNQYGRIWYNRPLKLWSKKKNVTASFNTTFVLNISPNGTATPIDRSWGHGITFILSGEKGSSPKNSHGRWLGIVNETTNSSTRNDIVAVEFDTNKSYPEDIDDNHVGIDVNSIYSIEQAPLTPHGVNLSSRNDVTATLEYNGISKVLVIYVFMSDEPNSSPIISRFLNLSGIPPQQVYVGFSASTGEYAELNCVKSWSFTRKEIDDEDGIVWVLWIVIPIILLVVVVMSVLFYKWRNFDSKNELGRGGFGVVYRALLGNKEVAVKRLNNSCDGKQEFMFEVTIIGNLHHKNLVKLVGWCHEDNELLVVYEFMPNGSLDKMIYRKADTRLSRLSWEKRHVIISGVAEALDYLHNGCENRVLHRDIKASNIMLDSEFNPRLGDFGLARAVLKGEAYPPHVPRERPVFMWPAGPPLLNEIMEESLAAGQLSPITILTSGR